MCVWVSPILLYFLLSKVEGTDRLARPGDILGEMELLVKVVVFFLSFLV